MRSRASPNRPHLDGRPFDIACGQIDIGNAATEMTAPMKDGVPQADGRIAPEPTMAAEDVARAVLYMDSLPLSANVLFMTVMATKMPYIGRGLDQGPTACSASCRSPARSML